MTEECKPDWELDKPSKSAAEILKIVDDAWKLKQEIDAAAFALDLKEKEYRKAERDIQDILESENLPAFNGTFCSYELKGGLNYRAPVDECGWAAFKAWMKERDAKAYETLFKMHAGTLKSLVAKEFAAQEKKGEELNIPGIPLPETFTKVVMKERK